MIARQTRSARPRRPDVAQQQRDNMSLFTQAAGCVLFSSLPSPPGGSARRHLNSPPPPTAAGHEPPPRSNTKPPVPPPPPPPAAAGAGSGTAEAAMWAAAGGGDSEKVLASMPMMRRCSGYRDLRAGSESEAHDCLGGRGARARPPGLAERAVGDRAAQASRGFSKAAAAFHSAAAGPRRQRGGEGGSFSYRLVRPTMRREGRAGAMERAEWDGGAGHGGAQGGTGEDTGDRWAAAKGRARQTRRPRIKTSDMLASRLMQGRISDFASHM